MTGGAASSCDRCARPVPPVSVATLTAAASKHNHRRWNIGLEGQGAAERGQAGDEDAWAQGERGPRHQVFCATILTCFSAALSAENSTAPDGNPSFDSKNATT